MQLGTPKTTKLFIPKNSTANHSKNPLISIVVPALNEKLTIGEFIDWCWEGLHAAGVSGEILIVDSSSDETPQIALKKGARVLRTPKRGLGHAYIDAVPFIRGKFIIMGDCDLTYDFRELMPFIEQYKKGMEFVMGSRFRGSIEIGAMPKLHQYFGTPLTTWILNQIYHSQYTDIHCGIRGLTKEALLKINISSKDWEYASEMVLKASRLKLKIAEVPVKFYKDREGRLSHFKRGGFLAPWRGGWINLKVMLIYSPDTFLIKPAVIFFTLGLILSILSSIGGYKIGPFNLNIYSHLLGMTFLILGVSSFQLGILSRNDHGWRQGVERFIFQKLTYDVGMLISFFTFLMGVILGINFIKNYIQSGYLITQLSHSAIYALMFIILSIQLFSFCLQVELKRRLDSQI